MGIIVMPFEDALPLLVEQGILESRRSALPQVEALLGAGWTFEVPHEHATEPWQLYWRRPPRRKNSLGLFFWSTQQAYNALMRDN